MRILIHAALLVALAGCSAFRDAPEDAPAELARFEATLRLRKAWSAGIGEESEALRLALAPAVDGTRVYAAGHDGRVSAFDGQSGKRLWRTRTRQPLSAGPETDGDVVAVGSSDGMLLLLSAADGRVLWQVMLSSEVLAAPAVGRERVFVRTVDGRLTALARADGRVLWFVQQQVPRLSVRGTGAPVLIDELVICGSDNGRIAAYQARDGAVAWDTLLAPPSGRNEVERLADINATVRRIGADLYAVSYQGLVAQVALESGQPVWSQEVGGYTSPGVDAAAVYVTTTVGEIVALDRRNGRELWRSADYRHRDPTGPAPWGSAVAFGDFEGWLHVHDAATGAPAARTRVARARIVMPPVVAGDMLYIQADNGKIAAYTARPR